MLLMGLLAYFGEARFTGIESGDSSWGLDLWRADGLPQGDRAPDRRREGPGKKGEPVSSGFDKIHWPKEVHLADVDAAVAEDRVRHRNVEVDVRRRLPGKPGSGCFGIVASALHLVDQGLHVGRETAVQQHTDVKLLSRCKLVGLVEQALHILQGLDALRNDLIIHGIFLR